ncbi:cell wall-binding repeat-containing protein [Clostridium autoethanogenum]|uniref:Cell wall-binding repeat-containing protein n=1 Tax=Clostridium autoethanogenum DSM 10061 TaxID=1341692 RepID=A0ABN4BCV6_9CLOT|nr:cell wall-binding repeat-containing protein [Clostridium autoethanogenum]AGY75313.1 cell wall-binding repeat-containing protein [Clostridium autoethanogenum DSM 10061]ALU35479.1 Hypothetical protein CLAU_1050 [Clostridium autoethanogenum DSM 10061]OVY48562.1 N-acetylmuramoyl-L-alanine amidase LytC precursor [Clostridium autoethanogenum]
MKKQLMTTLVIAIVSLLFQCTVFASDSVQTSSNAVTSIKGSNYVDTSIKISQKGWTTSDYAIIASSQDFPDALGGTSLGISMNCPIFFASKDNIDDSVLTELKRLNAKNIYILGGLSSIGSSVEETLRGQGYSISRLAGNDRFSTAVAIGQKIVDKGKTDTVFISNAYGFADALSAATFAGQKNAPILLTNKDSLPEATIQAIKKWHVNKFYLIGGPGVISENVLDQLTNFLDGPDPFVETLPGNSRYETSQAIIKKFDSSLDKFTVVTGKDYHDALVAAPYASKLNQPILLMDDDCDDKIVKLALNKNLLVIGKSFLALDGKETTENGMTYTWNVVRDKVENAGIGKNVYRYIYDSYPYTGKHTNDISLYYNWNNKGGTLYDVWTLGGGRSNNEPTIDFGMSMLGCTSTDKDTLNNVESSYSVICEAIFPGHGEEFNNMTNNIQKRYVTKGNMQADLPNVFFFGGRRIFITWHSWGYESAEFSAINDTSDIWQEMKSTGIIDEIGLTRDELKKYMPELKNY